VINQFDFFFLLERSYHVRVFEKEVSLERGSESELNVLSLSVRRKIKKSTASSQRPGVSDDKENNVSLPAAGTTPDDKQGSAEKLLLLYDSNESSPRELSNASPHKVRIRCRR
jgi:hypothetical protein